MGPDRDGRLPVSAERRLTPFVLASEDFGVARRFDAVELNSFAIDDLVDAEAVFERIVARDVISLGVFRPPDEAGPCPSAQGWGLFAATHRQFLVHVPERHAIWH